MGTVYCVPIGPADEMDIRAPGRPGRRRGKMVMPTSRRVVLYQPPYGEPDSGLRPIAPLALLYLADALDRHGFESTIIDAQVEPDALSQLAVQTRGALAVGITSMTGFQIRGALAAAQTVRNVNPDLPIIWGGWHPSLAPDQTAVDPLVDAVSYTHLTLPTIYSV